MVKRLIIRLRGTKQVELASITLKQQANPCHWSQTNSSLHTEVQSYPRPGKAPSRIPHHKQTPIHPAAKSGRIAPREPRKQPPRVWGWGNEGRT